MRKQAFDGNQFHDSFLLSIDFTDWLNKITMLFWCPCAGEVWEDGRYLSLTLENILFFGFEASLMGLSGSGAVMFNEVALEETSEELDIWTDRFTELSKTGQLYPDLADMAKKTRAYHFTFDGYPFQGRAFLKKGFQIMCQDFHLSDVSHSLPSDMPKYHANIIESQ